MGLTWEELEGKLYKDASLKRVPLLGQFELTSRCNLHCKMCYVCKRTDDKEAIQKERTAEEWISLAREARDAGMLYLLLTGGEVFLRKDFMYIYSEIAKMGFNIEIYTNATLITPEIAKALGKIPPSKLGVTIYGASPETYEKVCGNANGFNLAMRGIDLLLSEGITVWVRTTVVKGNVDDFDKIADYAADRGIEFGMISYISPRREGGGTCPEAERLSPSEVISFERHANEYLKKKYAKNFTLDKDSCVLEEEIPEAKSNEKIISEVPDAFSCFAGKCAFWVTWDGKMTPCGLMDEPYTLPFDKGFKNSWDNMKKGCSLIPVCTECQECSNKEVCTSCPAKSKAEIDCYDKPAPYLCELAKYSNT